MESNIWQSTIRAAAAALLVVGSTAHAGGVFYQSDFDPLGFAGSAQWRVDDNCKVGGVLPDGYHGVNLLAPGGCDVALSSLTIQLWQGGPTPTTVWGTAALAASDPTLVSASFGSDIASPYLVAGIWVENNALAGVDTFLIGPEYIDNLGAGGTLHNNYGVQFTSGHSPLGYLASSFGGNVPALGNLSNPGAYLWEENYTRLTRPLAWTGLCPETLWASFACAKESTVSDSGGASRGDGYAPFTFRDGRAFVPLSVPEPGSLALLVGALGAGWISRRRRTAA